MTYYVLEKDGELKAIMLVSPYGLVPADWSVSSFEAAFPDLNTHEWNSDLGQFVRKTTTMSKLSFLNRFTLQERTAARASTDPIIVDILKMLDLAEIVDLNYPPTIQGIQYMAAVGILTAERATEVLS